MKNENKMQSYMVDALEGLSYLHNKGKCIIYIALSLTGITHGDIKLENILVSRTEEDRCPIVRRYIVIFKLNFKRSSFVILGLLEFKMSKLKSFTWNSLWVLTHIWHQKLKRLDIIFYFYSYYKEFIC